MDSGSPLRERRGCEARYKDKSVLRATSKASIGIVTALEGSRLDQRHQRRLRDTRRKSGGHLSRVQMSSGGRGPNGGTLDGRGDDKSALRHKQTRGWVSEGTSEDQSPLQSSDRAVVHKEGV